jgi:hypothetical protein
MVKKLVPVIVLVLAVMSLSFIVGCEGTETATAQELKEAGDAVVDQVGEDMKNMDQPTYQMRESYVYTIYYGEPQDKGDLAAIEEGWKDILDEIEKAGKEYEDILSLEGEEDYQSYAEEMLAFLDALMVWIESSLRMNSAMDEVQSKGAANVDAAAAAEEINDSREQIIAAKNDAARLYNAAYQIDKEKLHEKGTDADSKPIHIHLSWLQDPRDTVTVHWETEKWLVGYTPTVEYGTEQGSLTGKYGSASYLYNLSEFEQHEIGLTGLAPGTTYYYRCGSPGYGWSDTLSFRTPPAEKGGFTFCTVGDTRSASEKSADVSDWAKIAGAAAEEDPLFTAFLGDFIFLGYLEWMWPAWFEAARPLMEDGALMSCHGNHEEYAMAYFERFSFPANERWYSFDVSGVHFVCLDTGLMDYAEYPLLREQSPWLEEDLRKAAEGGTDWTIVFLHRPAYSAGEGYGDQPDIVEEWVPIFDRYGVDMVLESHEHFYQRSFPMKEGLVVDTSPDFYENTGGTVYLLQGCGGAPLTQPEEAEWAASVIREFSYTMITVSPGEAPSIFVETKNVDGDILDAFTIIK